MHMYKKGSLTHIHIRQKLALAAGLVLGIILLSHTVFAPVSAAPNDIVINELMYNPVSDNGADEYLELYNNTASPVDLEGWCFTSGINLCFTAGVTIGANDYLVISPNIAQTNTTYGVTAVAQYSGSLSNSGETITLRDNTNTIVNSVTYDDTTPWPITPDGRGPSLELNDPLGDTSDPQNWGASIGGPTPDAENSIFQSGTPIIRNVTDPNGITANTTVNVTAEVTGSDLTSVELHYKLNFDAEETLTMYDDGAHNDGAAGDNVYGATIPGQAEGNLVRFKIEATNDNGSTTSPRYDNTQEYHGYYIAKDVTTNAEVLEWFIEDSEHTDMLTNHRYDNTYFKTVLVYGDDVYDNTEVRIKGEISRGYTKTSYKMKLPKGYTINVAGGSDRLIDEFHVNATFHTGTVASDVTSWWIIEQAGLPVPDMIPIRIQKNGNFEGMYVLAEKYESEWREEYGRDNGGFYEDYAVDEIVSGASDLSQLDAIYAKLTLDRKDPARRDAILDEVDVPNMLNFSTAMTLLSSWDHYTYTNNFYYQDNDTKRWSMYFWDMSSAFSQDAQGYHYPSPYDHFGASLPVEEAHRFIQNAIYDQTDLRQLYMRRIRTVYDQIYTNDAAINYLNNLASSHADDMQLDLAKWPTDATIGHAPRSPAQDWVYNIRQIKQHLISMHGTPWGIPPSQTDAERQQVQIAEVVSSANNADEFIRLSNSASTAVDISNWFIEGIEYRIPAGAVIPAGGSIYLLRDDSGYKASHNPVLVAGQYKTDLSAVSGTILRLKTDQNMEIDSYDY